MGSDWKSASTEDKKAAIAAHVEEWPTVLLLNRLRQRLDGSVPPNPLWDAAYARELAKRWEKE